MSLPDRATLRRALNRAKVWRRYQRKPDPAAVLRPLGLRPGLVIDVGVGARPGSIPCSPRRASCWWTPRATATRG